MFPLLGLYEDLQLVMLVAIYMMLYWLISDTARNPMIALVIATIVFFVLVIPYEWVRLFFFITLVFYRTFLTSSIKPWEW